MPCVPFEINGVRGIACMAKDRRRCPCGNRIAFLCDWKTPDAKRPTCDAPLCARCTYKPAPDKDLCAKHRAAWEARGCR